MQTVDPDVRVFSGAGVFVRTIALYASTDASGAVAVFWVSLDVSNPPD
jgi:hypothetical protein